MAFKRKGGASYYFQARVRDGYKSLSTGTDRKAVAKNIEDMWHDLATGHRAWDVLDAVLDGRLKIGELYDRWTVSQKNVDVVRRDLEDVDLAAFVSDFTEVYGKRRPKALARALAHLRWLLPTGETLPRSLVTKKYFAEKFNSYRDEQGATVSGNTLRRVHSAWSTFFDFLVERDVYESNAMGGVKAPVEQVQPVEWYELPTCKKVVAGAPTPELRAAFALAYGGALELGAIITLRREQVDEATEEVHALGTKAHKRNRVVRVDAWAWPYIKPVLANKTPTALLFPEEWRKDPSVLSKAHKRAVTDMKLDLKLTLHHARHAWAVRNLRAGVPVAVAQHQLGHSTPTLTLRTYGGFIPLGEDRAHWAEVVEQHQARRTGVA